MDKKLTKEQIQTILSSAPKNLKTEDILNGFVKKGYTLEGFNDQPKQPTLIDRAIGTVKEIAQVPGKVLDQSKSAETITTAVNKGISGEQNPLSAGLQVAGGLASAGGNAINEATKGLVKAVLPKEAETAVKNTLASLGSTVASNPFVQSIVEKYHSLSPEQQANIDATGGVASLVSNFVGVQGAGAGTKVATKGIAQGAEAAGQVVKTGAENVAKGVTTVTDTLGNAVEPITGGIKAIKNNIGANIEAVGTKQKIIQALPTEQAKTAVRSGIDVADVNTLARTQKENLPLIRKIEKTANDFASGISSKDPIEVVGQPLVSKLKQLEKQRQVIGSKLGEAAKNLGIVEVPELRGAVFSRLQKVKGLEDLKITPKGILDFSNTTLLSQATKSDRKAIQDAFTQATKWGNGEKAHKYRQELFETLGGKKRSLANITDTQEKALEAVRSGISDVLDTKNPTYKALNQQYAKTVQPLQDLRKFSKTLDPNNTSDILDLSAGLLARRLTSNAPSNPLLRKTLKALDEATSKKGVSLQSTQDLIDAYNVIGKYYDISAKTGFKGQTEQAIDRSLTGLAVKAVQSTVGQSPVARQKALKVFLDSLHK